eukprot:2840126-Lingulodinium_polyedra.AAC.1
MFGEADQPTHGERWKMYSLPVPQVAQRILSSFIETASGKFRTAPPADGKGPRGNSVDEKRALLTKPQ